MYTELTKDRRGSLTDEVPRSPKTDKTGDDKGVTDFVVDHVSYQRYLRKIYYLTFLFVSG